MLIQLRKAVVTSARYDAARRRFFSLARSATAAIQWRTPKAFPRTSSSGSKICGGTRRIWRALALMHVRRRSRTQSRVLQPRQVDQELIAGALVRKNLLGLDDQVEQATGSLAVVLVWMCRKLTLPGDFADMLCIRTLGLLNAQNFKAAA